MESCDQTSGENLAGQNQLWYRGEFVQEVFSLDKLGAHRAPVVMAARDRDDSCSAILQLEILAGVTKSLTLFSDFDRVLPTYCNGDDIEFQSLCLGTQFALVKISGEDQSWDITPGIGEAICAIILMQDTYATIRRTRELSKTGPPHELPLNATARVAVERRCRGLTDGVAQDFTGAFRPAGQSCGVQRTDPMRDGHARTAGALLGDGVRFLVCAIDAGRTSCGYIRSRQRALLRFSLALPALGCAALTSQIVASIRKLAVICWVPFRSPVAFARNQDIAKSHKPQSDPIANLKMPEPPARSSGLDWTILGRMIGSVVQPSCIQMCMVLKEDDTYTRDSAPGPAVMVPASIPIRIERNGNIRVEAEEYRARRLEDRKRR
ncbi:hypothetical protein C8R44DRAFT_752311 [Mycena epipterygia]|nr:hypothetical protein C8R44DRAFT_752311 [Mycena epipterygia]